MLEKITELLGIKKAVPKDFVRRRILIVDDNKVDLTLIQKTVERIGHEVLTAENGNIGFQTAKEKKPDLILADCQMPELDGVEMCKLLKEDEGTKNIPIVFLTNVNRPATVIDCFDMGVDNYICKPINPKILISQIKSIFKEHFSV